MNCVQWFRKSYPHVLAFHVPNGEWRHQHTADKLQRMGVLPGVADWLFFSAERSCMIAVEFKSKTGKLNDEQKKFNSMWQALGGGVANVSTLEGFQAICIDALGNPVNVEEIPATGDEPAPLEVDEAAVQQMIAADAEPQPVVKMPWEI